MFSVCAPARTKVYVRALCMWTFFLHTVEVCVVDHVLEVYSFDSIALHMDGLNQIPQTQ